MVTRKSHKLQFRFDSWSAPMIHRKQEKERLLKDVEWWLNRAILCSGNNFTAKAQFVVALQIEELLFQLCEERSLLEG